MIETIYDILANLNDRLGCESGCGGHRLAGCGHKEVLEAIGKLEEEIGEENKYG